VLINLYNHLGEEINLASLGLIGLKLEIPSPSYRKITEVLDGRCGVVVIENILDSRPLTASFMVTADNYDDSLKSRNQLYELIGNGQVIYVAEARQPTKRWKVYADGWLPKRINVRTSIFDVPLFAESGTSESISAIEKSFNDNNFSFKNEGNIIINPRIHSETEIEFTGSSTNLTIKNITNSDEWSYTGDTMGGDKILLKSVRSLKNDVSIFGQTNKKLITMDPGWNDFEIVGATGVFQIAIKTRFYFL